MPDVLAQDDVLSPGSDVSAILSGSRYDAGPSAPVRPVAAPVAQVVPPASQPQPVAVPPQPGADLTPQIAEARRQSEIEIGKARAAGEREESLADQRERELAPLRKKQLDMAMSNLDRTERAQRTLEEKTKTPPEPPKRQNQHDDENWLFAAGLLGALAGAFTRNHATNALAAFQGALQGYQEGSREKFDQNMKIWEAENKKIIESNNQAMNEYKSILENTKLSNEQMSIALQVAASKYDDQAMAISAKSKSAFQIAQHYDKEAQALSQLQESYNRIKESSAAAREREQSRWRDEASAYVTSPEGVARINAIKTLREPPPPANSRTSALGFRDQAVRDELSKDPDFNFNSFNRGEAVKKIEQTTDSMAKRAGETAGARTREVAATNIETVMRSAAKVIPQAAAAASRVPATGFPKINELMQAAEENIGDPALRAFRLANIELAETFARAMNPRSSIVSVANMNRAVSEISTADSPEAYTAMLHQIRQFVENQYSAIQEERRRDPLGSIEIPGPERRLQPTPRTFLPKGAGTVPGTDVSPPPGMRSIFGDTP